MISFIFQASADKWTLARSAVSSQQYDNLTAELRFTGAFPVGWTWYAVLTHGTSLDQITLTDGDGYKSAMLTDEQLCYSGTYQVQLVAQKTVGDDVLTKHSNVEPFVVAASLSGDEQWPTLPTAFTQAVQQATEAAEEAEESADRAEAAIPTYTVADAEKMLRVNSTGTATEWAESAAGSSDFDTLTNRPKYNGTVMSHATNIPEVKTATWDAKADGNHTHDERYYTEAETNTLLSAKASAADLTAHTGNSDVHVTAVLQTAWNSAVTWISTNGQNLLSHLTDAVKHITASERSAWNAKADTEDIPTKTSDLTNDSGFLTEHQSLAAYRTSAAQDVIDATKVDKVSGKGLSTNDYTDADKTKVGNAITEHQSLAAYRTSAAQDIIDSGKESTIGSTHHIDGDYVDFDSSTTVNDKISVLSTQVDGKISKSAQATKTSAMTSEVGIDANGKLWSAAGGGGSVDYFTVVNGELCIVYEES